MQENIVIPMLKPTWCTRAVIEGLSAHYQPSRIHIISPAEQCESLQGMVDSHGWQIGDFTPHPEESFFVSLGLSKNVLSQMVDLSHSLYSPGWFYQQLLKLGAWEGIPGLSEDYLVWDADLLPIHTWPVFDDRGNPIYALLQHNSKGNPDIVGRWERWIREVLGVEPLTDDQATFVPHHMWFNQTVARALMARLGVYYNSQDPWPVLMMRSANDFGTYSEYWLYASWLASHTGRKPAYYPYAQYGNTTERFFDDGTGPFSSAMREYLGDPKMTTPSYQQIMRFIDSAYLGESIPSSIAFEQSPRHIKKNKENMHLEEVRSRWHEASIRSA
ncbi:MAG: DUF6492 family protein [Planctomycetota bacterium]